MIRSFFEIFVCLSRQDGGLSAAVHKSLDIYKREGWGGFMRRLNLHRGSNGGFVCLSKPLDASKKTLLIVSHEASRTGAPILCLNIVKKLREDYNIVTLLLRGGPLMEDFLASSNATLNLGGRHVFTVAPMVRKLLKIFSIDGAVVNSTVSYPALLPLARAAIPTISLIHEFTAYVRPLSIMEDIICCSSDLVFSSPITMNDAQHWLPAWAPGKRTHILPQGRCLTSGTDDPDKIQKAFRPGGWPDDTKIVLGAGSVEMRKGVDLFIQCAARILSQSQNKNIRFVWIGGGYDPQKDLAYSLYLSEQVHRSGLSSHFEFVSGMGSLDTAYQEADLFLLTSRLDPLPNVGIDAICCGLPILCFEKGSGIAPILAEEGMQACVAPYLDTSTMADIAVRIFEDQPYAEQLSQQLSEIGQRRFDMDNYVSRLEAIVKGSLADIEQETAIVQQIMEKGIFDLGYWKRSIGQRSFMLVSLKLEQAVRLFVRGCRSGFVLGVPCRDFDKAQKDGMSPEKALASLIAPKQVNGA